MIAQLNLFAFGFLFVELVVTTPVEWRTFVSVTPAATKSILDSFFLQNILFMYILSMTQQKAGQKTDTNPKKNMFLQFYLIWPCPNLFQLDLALIL